MLAAIDTSHWEADFVKQRAVWNLFAAVFIVFGLLVSPATAVSPEIESEIAAAQSRLDTAFANADPDEIREMVTSDHVAVTPYYPGPTSIDGQIAALAGTEFDFLGEENRQIFELSDSVVLITQEKLYTGSRGGVPMPSRVAVAAIWVQIDGKWLQRYYQETAILTAEAE